MRIARHANPATYQVTDNDLPLGLIRQPYPVSLSKVWQARPEGSTDWAHGFATRDDAAQYLVAIHENHGR